MLLADAVVTARASATCEVVIGPPASDDSPSWYTAFR